MPARLHLLPWDQPLLPRVVAWLAGDWRGGAPLDLSSLLIVVPTRQSGRRLREALAGFAAEHGQAVFPPRVLLPEGILGGAGAGAASRMETLLAWAAVFREIDLDAFREVFPVDPPARSFAWALRLAGGFARLKATLGEAGLRLADVRRRAGPGFAEAARWEEIAELERRYAARLAARGRRDLQDLRLEAAAAPGVPPGVRRIAVLGTPDPLPLALAALDALARTLPVDIVVAGPLGGEALFDDWGRPRTEAWARRELDLPDFAQRVHLCADPLAQAERVVTCARRYGAPEGRLAVGVADGDVLPFLENGLARAGLAAFDPEGRPFRREAFFALLEGLAALAGEDSFEAAAALARCPAVLEWCAAGARAAGRGFSPARLLAGLDELRARHLPVTLAAARDFAVRLGAAFPEVPAALDDLAGLRRTLTAESFPAGALAALGAVYGGRWIDFADPQDAQLAALADAWRDVVRQAAAAPGAGELAAGDWWELALQLFGDGRRFDEKPAGAIELLGWLELLWEDAPHLIVAGLNDGRVPEAIAGDPFLPEALRAALGLKTNADRLARDAYLLQALAAGRARDGRLDLLFGKTSAAGDPLRPSRLLLRCADGELPERVRFLFRQAEVARASQPWQRAWLLQPRRAAAPAALPVTAFRDYLVCPFRFYLGRVLAMAAVDPEKTELDAADFGTLCHAALEAMGREPALRDCTDAAVLRDFLFAALEQAVRARLGPARTLPLVVQIESARQRLAKAAEVQARERAAGWVIEQVEWRFPDTPAFALAGRAIRGTIDRIDRHEGTGARRVLDYKTADTARQPQPAHCRPAARAGRADAAPEFAQFTVDGRAYVWTDLQLPLYLWALGLAAGAAGAAPPAGVGCGYFNLPKAVGDTGVQVWEGYGDAWHEAALRCARGVAGAIAAGRFWPPAEAVAHDAFAALFHHGVAASVAPEFAAAPEVRP